MSIQRACQHCGKRLHGTTPGAVTIMLDGQPLEASIVLCAEGAIDVRRALDQIISRAHRRAVAQHAQRLNLASRAPDQTTILRPPADAMTEHFATAKALLDESGFQRETHGAWMRPALDDVAQQRRRSLGWRRKPS